jgi:hypothetical protein
VKPFRLALLGLASALLQTSSAMAHHPGSHASRLPDGRVKLEVGTSGDGCTTVGAISAGVPAGVSAPPGASPVTVRLNRPPETVCTMELKPVAGEAVLVLPAAVRAIHVFILGQDGTVRATERVPIH